MWIHVKIGVRYVGHPNEYNYIEINLSDMERKRLEEGRYPMSNIELMGKSFLLSIGRVEDRPGEAFMFHNSQIKEIIDAIEARAGMGMETSSCPSCSVSRLNDIKQHINELRRIVGLERLEEESGERCDKEADQEKEESR